MACPNALSGLGDSSWDRGYTHRKADTAVSMRPASSFDDFESILLTDPAIYENVPSPPRSPAAGRPPITTESRQLVPVLEAAPPGRHVEVSRARRSPRPNNSRIRKLACVLSIVGNFIFVGLTIEYLRTRHAPDFTSQVMTTQPFSAGTPSVLALPPIPAAIPAKAVRTDAVMSPQKHEGQVSLVFARKPSNLPTPIHRDLTRYFCSQARYVWICHSSTMAECIVVFSLGRPGQVKAVPLKAVHTEGFFFDDCPGFLAYLAIQ